MNTILNEIDDVFRVRLERFLTTLNKEPKQEELMKAPDGKAWYLPISHVEMTLDENFFGLWSTENFRWTQIQNEIVGSIDLIVMHPLTGFPLKRTGAASLQIMVDSVPDAIKTDNRAKNTWSLDPANKKPNALDMGFPKLKADCLKNAALSLGKSFGRDLNRKAPDVFKPLISGSQQNLTRIIDGQIAMGNFEKAQNLLAGSKLPEEVRIELQQKIAVKS